MAQSQSAGRGRNGRAWVSEPGNLHASLLLIDPAPLARAPELGFVASLAAACALQALVGGAAKIALKWPNDMLCDGAKIGGVLLESATLEAEGGKRLACVAGFGVNCRSHPSEALYPAGDLSAAAGRPIDAGEALRALAAETAHWLGVWAQAGGFALVRREWLARAAGLGEHIRIARRGGDVEGVYRTIDESGRLVLDLGAAGDVSVDAGDVFLARPA